MRLRLILSFILIVIVSIASVALIARRQTVTAVHTFMYRGGLSGTEGLIDNLETYYSNNGTWEGVDEFFRRQGRGMGQGQNNNPGISDQRLQLADENGVILLDTQDENPSGRLNLTERNRSTNLEVDGQIVGYLLPESSSQISQIATDALVNQINRAAFTAGCFCFSCSVSFGTFSIISLIEASG